MKNKKMKVILSTFGPLHLIKSAEFLSTLVDIHVIQGWIPAWWNRWLLKPISKVIGYDLSRTITKRTPESLNGRNVGLGIPDFINNASRMFLTYNLKRSCMCWSSALYGRQSKAYIKDADVFHVRSGSGRGGAIDFAKSRGMKVLTDHSIAHPAFMEDNLRSEYERMNINFDPGTAWHFIQDCIDADAVVVNSTFVKDTFVGNGFSADKIHIAYLGVRSDFWSLKRSYDLNDDGKLRILFTGSFGFRKGAEYLLEALVMLDNKGVEYECTVVGSYGNAIPLIEKYNPKGLNLKGFIPQDELKSYLASSDVYLFPSLCEGCASSGMEAMAAGLPVIATKESGFPIISGQNGVIVQSKCSDSIVDALIALKNDKSMREKIGVEAAQDIKANYTWEKYAEKIVSIYEYICSK